MRIFLIAEAVPAATHDRFGITAVHVVVHEFVRGLTALGHEVTLQILFNRHRVSDELTPAEQTFLRELRTDVRIETPIHRTRYERAMPSWTGKLRRVVDVATRRVDIAHAYPAGRVRASIAQRVHESRAQVILTVWSPGGVAATHGLRGPLRVAYQGDLDFEPGKAQYKDEYLFPENVSARSRARGSLRRWLGTARDAIWSAEFVQAHDRMMRELDLIANVSATNVPYYRRLVGDRSIYIRNMWRDAPPEVRDAPPRSGSERPLRIIGHAGRLDSSTSRYGLDYLMRQVLPALERELAGIPFEVHVTGGGQLVPSLRPLAEHPRVVMRGFVDDLDAELRASPVYLLLNNAGRFQAAHTRHLLAWSLGACLLVHYGSTRALPEIRSMDNALVGHDGPEIARLVRLAATDVALNVRLREAGRRTYERWFTPKAVIGDLMGRIEKLDRTRHRS